MNNLVKTWNPTSETIDASAIHSFMEWLAKHKDVQFKNYRELHAWSVDHVSDFWSAVVEYFEVLGEGLGGPALTDTSMPGAVWFPDARLNFAENVLKFAHVSGNADKTAIVVIREDNSTEEISWAALERKVASLAFHMRALGVGPGDRVAAVLPNIPEAIIGLLAAASIGAIWTISSPDLAPAATINRLKQLQPRVLFVIDGYEFNSKVFDTRSAMREIRSGLPTVEHVIQVSQGFPQERLFSDGIDIENILTSACEPDYARLPFDHPLWVLFSSGTTGAPKGIVHGHGGMMLEALKSSGLNFDVGPADRYYVAANTSWMVWNTLVNNLIVGASVVTYSGSPFAGGADRQFEIMALTGATAFMTGAGYLSAIQKQGLRPGDRWDLTPLRLVFSTGSPLPESTWTWFHDAVKAECHLGSVSGGTDICSGFIGSNMLEPVVLGELQGPALGVAIAAWNDEGKPVLNEVGEMVITQPMPSMPLYFWDDIDGSKYRSAYFDKFDGAWAQGDWITQTDRGSFVVHGRSDATLNRGGVRLGSADIYEVLQAMPEIRDSMVLGIELPQGDYYMPLFIVLQEGQQLTDELKQRIEGNIRAHTSARHVPDDIRVAPEIPVTHAGKKIEVPIKKLFSGVPADKAINFGALANVHAADWFIEQARIFLEDRRPQ